MSKRRSGPGDQQLLQCPRDSLSTHETLGVFTNNDHVDLLPILTRDLSNSIEEHISLSPEKGRPTISERVSQQPAHRSNRSNVGIEVQMFSQSDDWARVSFHLVGRGRHSAEHCSVTFLPHDAADPMRGKYPWFSHTNGEAISKQQVGEDGRF